ncbi:MAG: 3-hydroxyacyl-CoA dehydrogenase NAD-binding domain-containing protein [Betaproteobacteria bacterium]
MRHWNLTRDAHGIAWMRLDTADASMNKLSAEVLAEFSAQLDEFDLKPPSGMIIQSAKDSGFIAGADVEEFKVLDKPQQAQEIIARGWHLFNRLAAVPYPKLSLIRGICLGGGLEISLACRYRIAVDEPATRLGLPEVLLGIVPGWGGMMRLPRLIGPQAALDMMLTGKTLDARRAKRAGLVDLAVPARLMERSAAELIRSGRPPHRPSGLPALMNHPLMRPIIAAMAKKQVAKKARPEHYPAPYAIIDLWQKADGDPLKIPQLMQTIIGSPTTKNLLRVFFLQERLKSLGKESSFKAKHLHVIGAGTMGGDIAAWGALRGLTVTLQDQDISRIAPAMGRAGALFKKRLRDPLLRRAAMDRLIPDTTGEGIQHADVVIEAIFEDLQAKHALLQQIEPRLKPGAILATNTSSLRIEDLRTALADPSRLVGIHFFNPVAMMPLVEVIAAAGTQPQAAADAAAFVRSIDKLPLPVKSAPGFLVNAVLAPYMLGAMRKLDEGVAPNVIDAAMRRFGMPMGPIELADTVGLDIALAAGRQLSDVASPPTCLMERVEQGHLGKKSGRGFYEWSKGAIANRSDVAAIPEGLAESLIAPLVDRTEALVQAGVIADADLADAGVIFSTGFAPFRGGPLNWNKTRSIRG